MGIFGAIRDAIFGRAAGAPSPAPQSGGATISASGPAQTGGWDAVAGQSAGPAPAAAPAAPAQPVDVGAVLAAKSAAKGDPDLNHQTSIVDLMKLLDLDSSLAARSQLADELGYTGEKNGSAEMNMWLHRKVMEELERNGGAVPEAMKS